MYDILHTYTGYGPPPKGGNAYMQSPGDSAIGTALPSGMASGIQSGVQTSAHSEVGPGDLQQLEDEDIKPPIQPQQPQPPPQPQQQQQQQSFGKRECGCEC